MSQITSTISSNGPIILWQPNARILTMPLEILNEIFTQLSIQDIGTSTLVCKKFQQVLYDNQNIWQNLFSLHYPSFLKTNIPNFKDVFLTLYTKWQKGIYVTRTLQSDQQGIFSLAIADGKLISGSPDGTIKIWDLYTGQCARTLIGPDYPIMTVAGAQVICDTEENTFKIWDLTTKKCTKTSEGHQDRVKCLGIAEGELFSGSDDHNIKIWDLTNGKCIATLIGHHHTVSCLTIAEGQLISASNDNMIKIWDLTTRKCINTLVSHQNSVDCLAIAEGQLISGSLWDKTLKIWDLTTGKCTYTLENFDGNESSLLVIDGKLISVFSGSLIKIWDLTTGQCTHTLEGHETSISCLREVEGKLVSCSTHIVRIWDLTTGKCTHILKGHQTRISSLVFTEGKLITASDDNTIKIWDFTADHAEVFRDIAKDLTSGIPFWVANGFERFLKMPTEAKNAIYGKLYDICKPFVNDYLGCEEHAFHNQYGQFSTPAQKAQAIEKYLMD